MNAGHRKAIKITVEIPAVLGWKPPTKAKARKLLAKLSEHFRRFGHTAKADEIDAVLSATAA